MQLNGYVFFHYGKDEQKRNRLYGRNAPHLQGIAMQYRRYNGRRKGRNYKMKIEEQLQLMVQSEIDSFERNYFDALDVYFSTIRNALPLYDFIKIQFSIERICEYFKVDRSSDFESLKELRAALFDYNANTNTKNKENEKIQKFWLSFFSWYNNEKNTGSHIFDDKYRIGHYEYDSFEREIWIDDGVDIKEEIPYQIEYGEKLQLNIDSVFTFQEIKKYLELIYSKFLKSGTDGRYPFTKQVNDTFTKFGLPYKMTGGKIKKQDYKTSFIPEKILNYEQFERKIAFSEQMILYDDFMDKHSALQYIADAFCFFYSLFKNDGTTIFTDEKTNIKIAEMVHSNKNEKQYALIKSEIENVKKIINSDYDIRHNEYYRSEDKSKREALTDIYLVEYLYNRIFALLYILRLKYKPTSTSLPEINMENLPF